MKHPLIAPLLGLLLPLGGLFPGGCTSPATHDDTEIAPVAGPTLGYNVPAFHAVEVHDDIQVRFADFTGDSLALRGDTARFADIRFEVVQDTLLRIESAPDAAALSGQVEVLLPCNDNLTLLRAEAHSSIAGDRPVAGPNLLVEARDRSRIALQVIASSCTVRARGKSRVALIFDANRCRAEARGGAYVELGGSTVDCTASVCGPFATVEATGLMTDTWQSRTRWFGKAIHL